MGSFHGHRACGAEQPELARRGMEDSELMVYGRLPMMVSAQCLTKTVKGCTGKPGWMYLKDRKGKRFPVKTTAPSAAM